MSFVIEPQIAKEVAEGGGQSKLPFQSLFKSLVFAPDSAPAKARPQAIGMAKKLFTDGPEVKNLLEHTWVPDTSRGGSAIKQSKISPENGISVVVPWPALNAKGSVKLLASTYPALLRRFDATDAPNLVELMKEDANSPYFKHCTGLGVVAGEFDQDSHWVWLMREIIPSLYVMYPMSTSPKDNWTLQRDPGGYPMAQIFASAGSTLILPEIGARSQVWTTYWSILFDGGILEVDPPRLSGVKEASSSRMDLASEVINEAVMSFQKLRPVLGDGYSAESRDMPALDKPSFATEILGAVTVATGVALATAVAAAIV